MAEVLVGNAGKEVVWQQPLQVRVHPAIGPAPKADFPAGFEQAIDRGDEARGQAAQPQLGLHQHGVEILLAQG